MKKYTPIAVIIGLMLVTVSAIMLRPDTQVPQQTVGGAAQRWSYSTVAASSTDAGPSVAVLLIATSTSPDILKLGEIINESSSVLYVCAFAATCTTSNGQPLVQYGYFTIDDANPYQGAIYGITASGTSTVSIRTTK